jgi:ADP-heptose:LPS heptosyltransferase
MSRSRVIAARSDSLGDVLVTGPALRAISATSDVVLLCGPRGYEAAQLLPGISEVICAEIPWIDPEPGPVRRSEIEQLVRRLSDVEADQAVIFTSFHQSALPLALLMRIAGVPRVAAISDDYPGSLLDVRHRDPGDVHEVERALSLAAAAGFMQPAGDDMALRITDPGPSPRAAPADGAYAVVHPGAAAPARMWPAELCFALVDRLKSEGWEVVVTGASREADLTARVAGSNAMDLGGKLSLRELAAVMARATVVVAPNTGPAHLAAAVGTPVVSLFAPVVSATRWRPWGVPHVLLGDQQAPCAGSRARTCPIAGHPCLTSVTPDDVFQAVRSLTTVRAVA